MLLNPPSEQEIALKKQEEQAKIDAALEKMFPDIEKPKKESYLKYEELLPQKASMGELTGKAVPQRTLDGFGQNVLNGLNTNKNIFPDLGNVTQKSLNNNFIQNNTTPKQDLTWQEKAFDNLLQNKTTVRGHFPVAADMYTDARTDFSRAKANKNATVLENMNSLDSKTQEALKNTV